MPYIARFGGINNLSVARISLSDSDRGLATIILRTFPLRLTTANEIERPSSKPERICAKVSLYDIYTAELKMDQE